MKNKENELSLIDIWNLLKQHFLLIFIFSSICFFISVSYTFFIATPNYISRADVMIQVEQDSSSSSDQDFDLVNAFRLIDTVAELMEKQIVLENVKEKFENEGYEDVQVDYIRKGLIINSSPTSYFINISFIDEDKVFAQYAVDMVIDAVIEETDVVDAFPVLTNKIRRTSFATEAVYNSPNRILFSLSGLFIGIFLSSGFILMKDAFTTKFRSKDEIESILKIQVLGVIPKMNSKEIINDKKKKS